MLKLVIQLLTLNILEQLSQIASIIGAFSFFLALLIFIIEMQHRKKEHELSTYDNLAKEYRDFLKLSLENQELQVFLYDFYSDINMNLSESQKIKKYMLFEILVSMLESAYYQYKNHKNDFKKAQWTGWRQYIYDWCSRKDFRIAWKEHLSSQFDSDFLNFINDIMIKQLEEEKSKQCLEINIMNDDVNKN